MEIDPKNCHDTDVDLRFHMWCLLCIVGSFLTAFTDKRKAAGQWQQQEADTFVQACEMARIPFHTMHAGLSLQDTQHLEVLSSNKIFTRKFKNYLMNVNVYDFFPTRAGNLS